MVESLKIEWKRLWQERIDDRIRAEGIAISEYSSLYVEQGTIIHATRDFKALNFKEILDQHKIENPERYIPPNPQTGGWGKFIKSEITSKKPQKNKRAKMYTKEKKKINLKPSKKGGRGWLHL